MKSCHTQTSKFPHPLVITYEHYLKRPLMLDIAQLRNKNFRFLTNVHLSMPLFYSTGLKSSAHFFHKFSVTTLREGVNLENCRVWTEQVLRWYECGFCQYEWCGFCQYECLTPSKNDCDTKTQIRYTSMGKWPNDQEMYSILELPLYLFIWKQNSATKCIPPKFTFPSDRLQKFWFKGAKPLTSTVYNIQKQMLSAELF